MRQGRGAGGGRAGLEGKVTNVQAVTEVMGNVYFCDFESAEREPEWPASVPPAAARSAVANLKLLVAQINATSKEIIAAHAEITRQAREQSRDLLAMVNVIDGIVFQADTMAHGSQYPGAHAAVPTAVEMRELAQGAAAAADELLALAREQVLHARNAARRLAEIGHHSGLIEHTIA